MNSFASLRDWFIALSLNQQLVILLVFCITLFAIGALYTLIKFIIVSASRRYRRAQIPTKIDLHLDRDIAQKGNNE